MTVPPRSAIIGHGALPVLCAEVLRRRGHEIVACSAPDARLRDWAAGRGVPFAGTVAELEAATATTGFDYLFSAANYRLLPPSLVARARRLAVNYHDGPLPRHAGMYATSWAIIEGETDHGIAWHVIEDEVDAGDLLLTAPVAITPSETAASLNRKCFTLAARTFDRLVAQLDDGTAHRVPQDPGARTYHGFHDRPPVACAIDFATPADAIARFVRGLTFAPSANPIGTPKLRVGDAWLAVGAVAVLERASGPAPGTVVAAAGDTAVVTTATHDVRLMGLVRLTGDVPDLDRLACPAPIEAGDAADRAGITEAYARAARAEGTWIRELARAVPLRLGGVGDDGASGWTVEAMHPSASIGPRGLAASGVPAAALLGRLADALRRTCASRGSVGISVPTLRRAIAGMGDLFESVVPVPIDEVVGAAGELDRGGPGPWDRRFTFARDLRLRQPERPLLDVRALEAVLSIADDPIDEAAIRRDAVALRIVVSTDGSRCHVGHAPAKAAIVRELRRSVEPSSSDVALL